MATVQHLQAIRFSRHTVGLIWEQLPNIDRWQVEVDGEWIPTATEQPGAVITGLPLYGKHTFRVRTGSSTPGPPSLPVTAPAYAPRRVIAPRTVYQLPLADGPPRQSFILRIADLDCRFTIHYQPSDKGWYCTIEIPQGTPYLSGRKLVSDGPIFDRQIAQRLGGNIWCRQLDAITSDDPTGLTGVWGSTHGLAIEVPTPLAG